MFQRKRRGDISRRQVTTTSKLKVTQSFFSLQTNVQRWGSLNIMKSQTSLLIIVPRISSDWLIWASVPKLTNINVLQDTKSKSVSLSNFYPNLSISSNHTIKVLLLETVEVVFPKTLLCLYRLWLRPLQLSHLVLCYKLISLIWNAIWGVPNSVCNICIVSVCCSSIFLHWPSYRPIVLRSKGCSSVASLMK